MEGPFSSPQAKQFSHRRALHNALQESRGPSTSLRVQPTDPLLDPNMAAGTSPPAVRARSELPAGRLTTGALLHCQGEAGLPGRQPPWVPRRCHTGSSSVSAALGLRSRCELETAHAQGRKLCSRYPGPLGAHLLEGLPFLRLLLSPVSTWLLQCAFHGALPIATLRSGFELTVQRVAVNRAQAGAASRYPAAILPVSSHLLISPAPLVLRPFLQD